MLKHSLFLIQKDLGLYLKLFELKKEKSTNNTTEYELVVVILKSYALVSIASIFYYNIRLCFNTMLKL